jgi:hypothetical protein
MDSKFALHNFAGKPTTFFLVEGEDLGASNTPPGSSLKPSHHIAVMDVSGSMYYNLADVKAHLEKVFTIEEFNDPNLKVTLITFSSNGDCRVHFERATVAEIMATGSKQLAEIRNLRVRGLTGISQGLVTAESLIDNNEVTAITLMSDGCANDPSPYTESRNIDAVVAKLANRPGVFVNSIAYGSWADFGLLDAVSSRLSGKTVKAASAKDVYQAIHDTTALLAGGTAPTVEAGIGTFDFITFVSHTAGKVLGSTTGLKVRGIKDSDDKIVFRYREVSRADFDASPAPVSGDGTTGLDPVLAYCRAQIAAGALNKAKFALISTRTTNLINAHYKAMTPTAIAEMAQAVEQHLFQPTTGIFTQDYGLGATGPSVLSVLGVLDDNRAGFTVNLPKLTSSYKRIGLKRVMGTREEDGTITPPKAKLNIESTEWVDVSGIEINRANATANIRLVRGGTLTKADGEVVTEVEGIKLDLQDFKNYAVVADGSVNVPVLPLRISDKRLHATLVRLGAITGDFDPKAEVDIPLADLPLVDFEEQYSIPGALFGKLARLTVLSKILAGRLKEESAAYTPEQVAALKELHITPALYFSPPTCNPYTDLNDAISKGEVDTRISYRVEVGTVDITNLGKLASGNAYLQKRFTFTNANGTEEKKPTLDMMGTGGAWAIKSLTARTKLGPVDDLSFLIYEDFLGLGSKGIIYTLLDSVGFDGASLHDAEGAIRSGDVDGLTALRRTVDARLDVLFRQYLSPLAFYVGSTGLMPDNLDVVAMTADDLTAKHPAVSLAKAEQEGLFYELPDGVLVTVYAKGEYFSTPAGVDVAKALQAA